MGEIVKIWLLMVSYVYLNGCLENLNDCSGGVVVNGN